MKKKDKKMKRSLKTIICVIVVLLLTAVLFCSCDFVNKIKISLDFQNKVKNSDELSFDMHLTVISDGEQSELDVSCYKNGDEYAYTFAKPDNSLVVYRRLFADEKLYEYLNTSFYLGSFYINDSVPYTDERNLLYTVIQKIMLTTYVTVLSTGVGDSVDGQDATRYDITHDGDTYSLWYDDTNLVKLSATVKTPTTDGGEIEETYIAQFKNYKFENVSTAPFLRPEDKYDALYVESPIAFEDWMTVINKFIDFTANWL